MIFSLFWEGAFIRGEVYFKIRDLRGCSFEGAFIQGGAFIRGKTASENFLTQAGT